MISCLLLGTALLALSWPDQPEPTELLIPLKVQARAAPKPALRYQLLPELRDMNPGNPVVGYLKCFMEQRHFFYGEEATKERDQLLAMPLRELAKKKIGNYGGIALQRADEAARLDNLDWQILPKIKRDGFHLVLPEIHAMRLLAWTLLIRFRVEIAEGRVDDALTTAKTMLALARHVAAHPTFIGHLVGVAIGNMALGPLDELLQQPNCPNLYWALTDLPQPLFDLRPALQGERIFLAQEFALLDEKAPMTGGQLQKLVERYHTLMDFGSKNPGPRVREWVAAQVKDADFVKAARQRLVECGLAEDAVAEFPSLQVVLLDGKYAFEVFRDDATKALSLPYWQAGLSLKALPAQEKTPFNQLVPAVVVIRRANARLQQRLALLRCVEALRLYAAAHKGKLPAQLAEVPVPLPVDPMTGQPFLYKLEGDVGSLRGTPPQGMGKNYVYRIHYRVSIAK